MTRITLLTLVALCLSACSLSASESGATEADIEVPRDVDGIETWDLRKPPTADEVGLGDPLGGFACSCRKGTSSTRR